MVLLTDLHEWECTIELERTFCYSSTVSQSPARSGNNGAHFVDRSFLNILINQHHFFICAYAQLYYHFPQPHFYFSWQLEIDLPDLGVNFDHKVYYNNDVFKGIVLFLSIFSWIKNDASDSQESQRVGTTILIFLMCHAIGAGINLLPAPECS